MGHVRDLPEKRLSVDVKHDFAPKYTIIKGKEKLVDELKTAAAQSDGIYLATDPDREGEAISWHLAYILGAGYQRAETALPLMKLPKPVLPTAWSIPARLIWIW